jgi:hypothetical protein
MWGRRWKGTQTLNCLEGLHVILLALPELWVSTDHSRMGNADLTQVLMDSVDMRAITNGRI